MEKVIFITAYLPLLTFLKLSDGNIACEGCVDFKIGSLVAQTGFGLGYVAEDDLKLLILLLPLPSAGVRGVLHQGQRKSAVRMELY